MKIGTEVFECVDSFIEQASSELLETQLTLSWIDENSTIHFEGKFEGEFVLASFPFPSPHHVLFGRERVRGLLVFPTMQLIIGDKLILQIEGAWDDQ